MTRPFYRKILLCLLIVEVILGQQVNFDGCTKNCAYCQRNMVNAAPPYVEQKSCLICHKSSPIDRTYQNPHLLDCSGTITIPDCEYQSVVIEGKELKPICTLCKPGYMRSIANNKDNCVENKLFVNDNHRFCKYGEWSTRVEKSGKSSCLFCKTDFSLDFTSGKADPELTCISVPDESKIQGCDNYTKGPDKKFRCRQCVKGQDVTPDGLMCVPMPKDEKLISICKSGFEKSKNMITCTQCNIEDGYYSVDSFFAVIGSGPLTQRQICGRPGENNGFILPLIIGGVVLLVIIIVLVLVCKRKKNSNQAELKGSMISNN